MSTFIMEKMGMEFPVPSIYNRYIILIDKNEYQEVK